MPRVLERLVAHSTHALLVKRELLSVLSAAYRFMGSSYPRRAQLWPSTAKERRLLGALAPPLLESDLRSAWSGTLTAMDRSPWGFGMSTRAGVARPRAGRSCRTETDVRGPRSCRRRHAALEQRGRLAMCQTMQGRPSAWKTSMRRSWSQACGVTWPQAAGRGAARCTNSRAQPLRRRARASAALGARTFLLSDSAWPWLRRWRRIEPRIGPCSASAVTSPPSASPPEFGSVSDRPTARRGCFGRALVATGRLPPARASRGHSAGRRQTMSVERRALRKATSGGLPGDERGASPASRTNLGALGAGVGEGVDTERVLAPHGCAGRVV